MKDGKTTDNSAAGGPSGGATPDSPAGRFATIDTVVVDDDSLVLEYFERTFRRQGVPIRTFIDGEEALAELLQKPASLLFVDSRMPLIDGIDLLEALHAADQLSNACAYLCSAARPPEDVYARAESIGVAVLLKEMQTDRGFLAMLLKNTERQLAEKAGRGGRSRAA